MMHEHIGSNKHVLNKIPRIYECIGTLIYIHIITLVSRNLLKWTLINCVYYSISSQALHIYILFGPAHAYKHLCLFLHQKKVEANLRVGSRIFFDGLASTSQIPTQKNRRTKNANFNHTQADSQKSKGLTQKMS